MKARNYCNCPSCMTPDCPAGIEEERLANQLASALDLLRRVLDLFDGNVVVPGLQGRIAQDIRAFLEKGGGQ